MTQKEFSTDNFSKVEIIGAMFEKNTTSGNKVILNYISGIDSYVENDTLYIVGGSVEVEKTDTMTTTVINIESVSGLHIGETNGKESMTINGKPFVEIRCPYNIEISAR